MSLVGILPDQLENRLGPMIVLAIGVGFVISAAMWWRWQILPNDADNNTSSLKAPVPTQLLNNPPPGVGGSAYSQGDRNQVQGGQGSTPGLGGLGGAGGTPFQMETITSCGAVTRELEAVTLWMVETGADLDILQLLKTQRCNAHY